MYELCEPLAEDEDNSINLKITPDMTKDDVVDEILNSVQ